MAVKRVLQNVKGPVDKGLVCDKRVPGIRQGFSHADSAGDHETRRPATGFMFILCGAARS